MAASVKKTGWRGGGGGGAINKTKLECWTWSASCTAQLEEKGGDREYWWFKEDQAFSSSYDFKHSIISGENDMYSGRSSMGLAVIMLSAAICYQPYTGYPSSPIMHSLRSNYYEWRFYSIHVVPYKFICVKLERKINISIYLSISYTQNHNNRTSRVSAL
jgi:hypothetical protein